MQSLRNSANAAPTWAATVATARTEAAPERGSMRCEAPDEIHDQVRYLGAGDADCVDSGELFRRKVSAYNLVLMLLTWGSGKANEGVLAPKSLHKFLEGPPTTTPCPQIED